MTTLHMHSIMKKSLRYKEYLEPAIGAMIQSASKDEYADANPPSAFKKSTTKKKIISNLREWKELRQRYKDSMEHAVEAMMASAMRDEYVDKNMPMQ